MWVSVSLFGFRPCERNSSMPAPFSGRSLSCGSLFDAPTSPPGTLCFGRRTEMCPKRTGPTRCSFALTASAASQTGTGTTAPSSFLSKRNGMLLNHEGTMSMTKSKLHTKNGGLEICTREVFVPENGARSKGSLPPPLEVGEGASW